MGGGGSNSIMISNFGSIPDLAAALTRLIAAPSRVLTFTHIWKPADGVINTTVGRRHEHHGFSAGPDKKSPVRPGELAGFLFK